jgi:microsomal dipeptidase-like Zn-dependent dipeptidase
MPVEHMRKFLASTAAVGVLLALAVFFFVVPREVDRRMNGVSFAPPYQASERARRLHERLFIADLHDDALLWSRDLLRRHDHGHADLPRLQEGRVGLQVFATVTQSPWGLNFYSNAADSDSITMLALAQRWPPRTWASLLERALYQGERLHEAAARSGGRMQVVRTAGELRAFTQAGGSGGRLAAILATEGLHPLEGRLENVERLYDAGFRIAGLTHFFDNEVGGSAHGLRKGGLTPFGRQVVRRLEDKHMLVDLAHASPAVIDEVLAMAKRPVLVSHTGVQGTCRGPRNLSDAHLRRIAATGGVIGIGYFPGAICGAGVASIVHAIRYTADRVGVQHVALGSDFDGATRTVFDATGLPLLTQGLLEAGFSEADIAAIMGGNVLRLLLATLPGER